jgi:hypothetical protein
MKQQSINGGQRHMSAIKRDNRNIDSRLNRNKGKQKCFGIIEKKREKCLPDLDTVIQYYSRLYP